MIRFDSLCAGYDGEERLHGITCAIPAGKLTALVGPNGCGKSTLLKGARESLYCTICRLRWSTPIMCC